MIIRFLHFLGFALWMGGGWAVMAIVMRARAETPAVRAGLIRVLPAAHAVIAGGALLTAVTGLWLTMLFARAGVMGIVPRPGLMLMQGAGILGALLVIALAWPTAKKMARLAPGDTVPPEIEPLRKRQAIVSSLAGLLALVSLVAATLIR